MAKHRLIRPGLDEYLRKHYGKVKNSEIAKKWNVTEGYLRNMAKRMGLTKPVRMPESFSNGAFPAGFSQINLVAQTKTGQVLKKGNLTRHVMR